MLLGGLVEGKAGAPAKTTTMTYRPAAWCSTVMSSLASCATGISTATKAVIESSTYPPTAAGKSSLTE